MKNKLIKNIFKKLFNQNYPNLEEETINKINFGLTTGKYQDHEPPQTNNPSATNTNQNSEEIDVNQ